MAAGGMRLTECYCPSPVCSPARAGFLTGRTPLRTGIDNYLPPESPLSLPASEITIAELLREQGYATGHFGKWHLSSDLAGDGPTTPADHGFDAWFATESNAEPEHNDPINFVRNGEPAGPMAGHSSAIIVEETLRWLDTLPADQPWFACLWFHSPHAPVSASPAYRARCTPKRQRTNSTTFGTLTETDAAIGKLDDAIAAKDPASGLLTVFTSDNGPAKLGDPPRHRHFGSSGGLRAEKGTLYEGGIRVPGIVRWPGVVEPGRIEDTPVNGVDWFCTFAAAGGATVPQDRHIDGLDVLPLLRGGTLDRTGKPLFWLKPGRRIRTRPSATGPGSCSRSGIGSGGSRSRSFTTLGKTVRRPRISPPLSRSVPLGCWPTSPAFKNDVVATGERHENLRPKLRKLYRSATASSERWAFFAENAGDGKSKTTRWWTWNSPGPHHLLLRFERPMATTGYRVLWGTEAAKRYRVVLLQADGTERVMAEVDDGLREEERELRWDAQQPGRGKDSTASSRWDGRATPFMKPCRCGTDPDRSTAAPARPILPRSPPRRTLMLAHPTASEAALPRNDNLRFRQAATMPTSTRPLLQRPTTAGGGFLDRTCLTPPRIILRNRSSRRERSRCSMRGSGLMVRSGTPRWPAPAPTTATPSFISSKVRSETLPSLKRRLPLSGSASLPPV